MSGRAISEISSSKRMPFVPNLTRRGQPNTCLENSRVETCPDSLAFFRRVIGYGLYRRAIRCCECARIKPRECVFSCVICGGDSRPLSPPRPWRPGPRLGAETIAPFHRNGLEVGCGR